MTTPIVIEIRRNGNVVNRPASTAAGTPATASAQRP
jgi:hypothetical protein